MPTNGHARDRKRCDSKPIGPQPARKRPGTSGVGIMHEHSHTFPRLRTRRCRWRAANRRKQGTHTAHREQEGASPRPRHRPNRRERPTTMPRQAKRQHATTRIQPRIRRQPRHRNRSSWSQDSSNFSSTSPCRTRRSPPVAHFSRVAPTFRLGCVRSGLRGRMSLISIRLSANTRCAEGHVTVN
jgi:hypothetical protein